MPSTIQCGQCGVTLDASAYAPGQQIRCGACNTTLVVPSDEPEPAPVPGAPSLRQGRATGRRGRRSHAYGSVPNLMPWAIAATFLCCQIGGIIAIVYAAQANSAARNGNIAAARSAADSARTWLWISAFSPLVVFALLFAVGILGR